MVIYNVIHMCIQFKVFLKSIHSKVFKFFVFNYVCYFLIPAFESFANRSPLSIPVEIEAKYVQFVEEIISISYTQSEKFSSVGSSLLYITYQ